MLRQQSGSVARRIFFNFPTIGNTCSLAAILIRHTQHSRMQDKGSYILAFRPEDYEIFEYRINKPISHKDPRTPRRFILSYSQLTK
ncbi:MAG: hypothetical protein JWQ09_1943 [Segetibacter sp.]|nr:hypothetical protein [Segetibacter sp.]